MSMRKRFQELLTEEMRSNEDIFLLVGDVGYKVFDHLREEYPERVINPGASEQLMIGMAAGLAMDGKIPVCYSITPFVLYRPFEFIRNYLQHEEIPVKLVGSGRNDDYGPCGFTHYAWEDMDVMKALPNIDIHYPHFPEEVDIKRFLYTPIPSYINLRR
jgi:transketolase|tara:strand:+ start:177 stop:653 length:477 start_codon:yes stop_codon:yes gene_type:complete